jgi:ferrous iron transport protein A
MTDLLMDRSEVLPAEAGDRYPLGMMQCGFRGLVHAVEAGQDAPGLPAAELERRLLELGFVEGATIEILHEGPIGRDPIAVRINNTTIALRRHHAMAILVILPNQAG